MAAASVQGGGVLLVQKIEWTVRGVWKGVGRALRGFASAGGGGDRFLAGRQGGGKKKKSILPLEKETGVG